jgi:hypothetical protein
MHPGEPHFFSPDIDLGPRHRPSEAEYFGFFESGRPEQVRRGEKSTFYLASELAAPRIIKSQPYAKFIVIIRNPIAMAYSWHAHLIRETTENCRDFERAWRLQYVRRQGCEMPRGCKEPWRLQYGEICSVGVHLTRWLESVPRNRMKVIIFDDLASNPKAVYLDVVAFLDIVPDAQSEFGIENEGAAVRSYRAQRLLTKGAHIAAWMKSATGIHRDFGFSSRLFSMNSAPKRFASLSMDFESELRSFFRPDVDALSQLTGRDLSHWLERSDIVATQFPVTNDDDSATFAAPDGGEAEA